MSNEIFKDYVRSTAFSISLSARQAKTLCLLVKGDSEAAYLDGWFVPSVRGLGKRGLVKHNNYPKWAKKLNEYTGLVSGDRPAYTVTEAGIRVYELLKIAEF